MRSMNRPLRCKQTKGSRLITLRRDRSPIPEKDPFVKVMSAKEFFGSSIKSELTPEEEEEFNQKNSIEVEEKFSRFKPSLDATKPHLQSQTKGAATKQQNEDEEVEIIEHLDPQDQANMQQPESKPNPGSSTHISQTPQEQAPKKSKHVVWSQEVEKEEQVNPHVDEETMEIKQKEVEYDEKPVSLFRQRMMRQDF